MELPETELLSKKDKIALEEVIRLNSEKLLQSELKYLYGIYFGNKLALEESLRLIKEGDWKKVGKPVLDLSFKESDGKIQIRDYEGVSETGPQGSGLDKYALMYSTLIMNSVYTAQLHKRLEIPTEFFDKILLLFLAENAISKLSN